MLGFIVFKFLPLYKKNIRSIIYLGVSIIKASMTDSITPKKSTRKPRGKKPRRHVWFEATVQNDHIHLQASAPTKWFRVLRWIMVVILIALAIHFMPEFWQAIQTAIQTVPK